MVSGYKNSGGTVDMKKLVVILKILFGEIRLKW